MEEAVFFLRYALLLLFGTLLTFAYAGIRFDKKKNIIAVAAVFIGCGFMQLAAYMIFDEETVWKIYPLIVHLPNVLALCLLYKKRIPTAVAAVATAYICCQPANWLQLVVKNFSENYVIESIIYILGLCVVGILSVAYFAPYLSELFQKDNKSVFIFGCVPMVYYLYDYGVAVYTDLWSASRMATEFLPLFLCIVYMLFSFVYYKEYEQKLMAEQKEQVVKISAQQQIREIEALKRSEQEIRFIRHDMRLLLSSLAVCIEGGENEKAQEIIKSYGSYIEKTKPNRFCGNDTLNYIISDFYAKCAANKIKFEHDIKIEKIKVNEIMLASVISNALDNALNAQMDLPENKREIRFMLKTVDQKLLISVKNPIAYIPEFSDGVPVARKEDHGYGTRSIKYMTERLGGNYSFTVQDGMFIVRVVL